MRSTVEHIDWEETEADDFIALTEGRFAAVEGVHAVEPIEWVTSETEAT